LIVIDAIDVNLQSPAIMASLPPDSVPNSNGVEVLPQ